MSSQLYETGAVVLGFYGNVAAWRRTAKHADRRYCQSPTLIITQAASTDEGAHEPAASVTLHGVESLIALRSAIDEALRNEVPA